MVFTSNGTVELIHYSLMHALVRKKFNCNLKNIAVFLFYFTWKSHRIKMFEYKRKLNIKIALFNNEKKRNE